MILLGIDPGLNTTGYGVLDVSSKTPVLLEAGVVRSKSDVLSQKIHEIYEGVRDIFQSFPVSALALEELYSHYERPRTAILMGHARGAICLAAAQANVPVFSYAATKIKKLLTGNGHASKDQMQRAVQLELRLKCCPHPHDVADALAVAICHHAHRSTSVLSNKTSAD